MLEYRDSYRCRPSDRFPGCDRGSSPRGPSANWQAAQELQRFSASFPFALRVEEGRDFGEAPRGLHRGIGTAKFGQRGLGIGGNELAALRVLHRRAAGGFDERLELPLQLVGGCELLSQASDVGRFRFVPFEQTGESLERLHPGGIESDGLSVASAGAVEVSLELESSTESGERSRGHVLTHGVAVGELGPCEVSLLEIEVAQSELNARISGCELGGFPEQVAGAGYRFLLESGSREMEPGLHGTAIAFDGAAEEARRGLGISSSEGEPPEDLVSDGGLARFCALFGFAQQTGVVEQPDHDISSLGFRGKALQSPFEKS